MSLDLLILTNYFALEPTNVQGGVGLRFVGLYGSLIKTLLKRSSSSRVLWYSHKDQSLRIINRNGLSATSSSMVTSVLNAVSESLKHKSRLVVIVAYPYAFPGSRKVLEYFLCLVILRVFGLFNVKVIIDDFDPPVEAAYAFNTNRPSLLSTTYQRLLELLTLRLSSGVLALSWFWKQYLIENYHVNGKNIILIPNGSLMKKIPYNPPKSEEAITVLYAGSAMSVKDVDKLVNVIAQLRQNGLNIRLCIAGAKLMDLPYWVDIVQYDWPSFVNKCLIYSDICVIPYPPNKVTFLNAVPAKLFDYMAAGKPIISTNLKYVRNILQTFECGLIAKDWTEFAINLKKLYYDRSLATKLGQNGRAAVQKHFDYELLATTFLIAILKMFKDND